MDEDLKKIIESGAVGEMKKLLPVLDRVRALSDEEYLVFRIIIEALIEKFSKPEEEKE